MLLSDLFRVGDTVRSRFNRQVRRVRCSPSQAVAWLMRVKSVCLTAYISPSASYLEKPQVTKGSCSWLGSSCVGIPSLRRRSVGPRRTDIPVLTALSPHPCGSAHCASSAFGQRPSRVLRRLNVMCMKIQIKSESTASQLKPTPQGVRGAFSGTGFSREEASSGAHIFGSCPRSASACMPRRSALSGVSVEEVWAGGRGASGAAFPRRAWERSSGG